MVRTTQVTIKWLSLDAYAELILFVPTMPKQTVAALQNNPNSMKYGVDKDEC